nr:reverse transcriptase domain-containing protein [Tanacetum cinerariifolium]
MESVFHISNCAAENQVKFATCTLHSVALTWWNTHVQTIGHEAAYRMSWKTLMKMMTNKYCPRNEIRKLEMELWELKVKGTNLASYTQCFQELSLLYGRMFFEESDKVENGVIELYFVNTEYQLADLFTKALGRDRIEFLINKLGMRSFTPETLKQLTDEVDE